MKSKMMKMLVAALALASFSLMGCDPKDADGNSYPTVQIGEQVWMAKNLNVKMDGSWCYENDPANCEKYGRLYNWEAAMKACPDGWHLPSRVEMETFIEAVKVRVERIVTQKKLNAEPLERGEDKWVNHLRDVSWQGGLNTFGFSALPAGTYNSYHKKILDVGNNGYFWSSTGYTSTGAYYLYVGHGGGASVDDRDRGNSVRCLQGPLPAEVIKKNAELIEAEKRRRIEDQKIRKKMAEKQRKSTAPKGKKPGKKADEELLKRLGL